ncbi:MAG TPA: hypothetical protein VLL05_12970 [Terriglobales bacterium]|nr:hypothetical protein [Terriglobales bacterium]
MPGSALLVAISCTAVAAVTLGAVKTPALVMVPADAVHTTSVLLAFNTCAANWWLAPDAKAKLDGEIATVTGTLTGAGLATAIVKLLKPSAVCGLSDTETIKENEPERVGWPVMDPDVELNLSPGGSMPERTPKE